MKCDRCNRPMNNPAFTMKTQNGPLNLGPKCAKLEGLANVVTRRKAQSKTTDDEKQLAIEFDAK